MSDLINTTDVPTEKKEPYLLNATGGIPREEIPALVKAGELLILRYDTQGIVVKKRDMKACIAEMPYSLRSSQAERAATIVGLTQSLSETEDQMVNGDFTNSDSFITNLMLLYVLRCFNDVN